MSIAPTAITSITSTAGMVGTSIMSTRPTAITSITFTVDMARMLTMNTCPDGEHVDHDYSQGRHVDHYRPDWSYDTYGRRHRYYDDDDRHTHRWYSDPGYYGRPDDDDDDHYNRHRYRYERSDYGYPRYDDYRRAPYGYDPYYAGSGSFDWKRGWPFLLGTMINAQVGR